MASSRSRSAVGRLLTPSIPRHDPIASGLKARAHGLAQNGQKTSPPASARAATRGRLAGMGRQPSASPTSSRRPRFITRSTTARSCPARSAPPAPSTNVTYRSASRGRPNRHVQDGRHRAKARPAPTRPACAPDQNEWIKGRLTTNERRRHLLLLEVPDHPASSAGSVRRPKPPRGPQERRRDHAGTQPRRPPAEMPRSELGPRSIGEACATKNPSGCRDGL